MSYDSVVQLRPAMLITPSHGRKMTLTTTGPTLPVALSPPTTTLSPPYGTFPSLAMVWEPCPCLLGTVLMTCNSYVLLLLDHCVVTQTGDLSRLEKTHSSEFSCGKSDVDQHDGIVRCCHIEVREIILIGCGRQSVQAEGFSGARRIQKATEVSAILRTALTCGDPCPMSTSTTQLTLPR
ncbi:hypothetical protein LAZ67_2004108 [Cordylochernes scorpioides]|uniref:Uncharacterized protein n=1 Tax=Cordylochernes scorpioides TaxID=51811 RepID=A0ABY6K3K1_9ARAC|nr:hypothetical protein LAZ67_2004108 [Cordylochernes scorpioides]